MACLSTKETTESRGQFADLRASIAGDIGRTLTPQQWEEYYATLGAHHIRGVHNACMWFEGISAKYPEYQFALEAHRHQFLRWYNAGTQYLPAIFRYMPPQVARVLHAYYQRVADPTDLNIEGFYTALTDLQKAMDSGEIQISHDD